MRTRYRRRGEKANGDGDEKARVEIERKHLSLIMTIQFLSEKLAVEAQGMNNIMSHVRKRGVKRRGKRVRDGVKTDAFGIDRLREPTKKSKIMGDIPI
jgi:hypothetical protein